MPCVCGKKETKQTYTKTTEKKTIKTQTIKKDEKKLPRVKSEGKIQKKIDTKTYINKTKSRGLTENKNIKTTIKNKLVFDQHPLDCTCGCICGCICDNIPECICGCTCGCICDEYERIEYELQRKKTTNK